MSPFFQVLSDNRVATGFKYLGRSKLCGPKVRTGATDFEVTDVSPAFNELNGARFAIFYCLILLL